MASPKTFSWSSCLLLERCTFSRVSALDRTICRSSQVIQIRQSELWETSEGLWAYSMDRECNRLEHFKALGTMCGCRFLLRRTSETEQESWRQVHGLDQYLTSRTSHHSSTERHGRLASPRSSGLRASSPTSGPMISSKRRSCDLDSAWNQSHSALSWVRQSRAFQSYPISIYRRWPDLSTSCSMSCCRYHSLKRFYCHGSNTRSDWNLARRAHQCKPWLTHSASTKLQISLPPSIPYGKKCYHLQAKVTVWKRSSFQSNYFLSSHTCWRSAWRRRTR